MGQCLLLKKDRYAAGQLHPINTGTFTTSTNSTAVDMGINNLYRYVNTTTVYHNGYLEGFNVGLDYGGNVTTNFSYTGGVQTYTVRNDGIYKLEVWGARGSAAEWNGGGFLRTNYGYGGYAMGYKILRTTDSIYVVCGGAPTNSRSGGYNGGGTGGTSGRNPSTSKSIGGGGGGASHIAYVSGVLSSIGRTTFDSSGLIIAAGGAGAGGENGWSSGNQSGGQSLSSGDFGQGGTGQAGIVADYSEGGGGGGGSGYYSGVGGNRGAYSGQGGSSWTGGVPSFTYDGTTYSPSTTSGNNNGAGKAAITLMKAI